MKAHKDIRKGDTKLCNSCNEFRPLSDFGTVNNKLRWQCKSCRATKAEYDFRAARYGISKHSFDEKLKAQDFKCAICESHFTATNNACIDHDHKTSRNRGIICRQCNWILGALKDNLKTAQKICSYLEFYNGNTFSL